jgi:hypothetical protein
MLLLSYPLAAPAARFAGGTGEPNNPYRIATAEQLISINSYSNLGDHYLLVTDIDLDPNLPGGRTFDTAVIGKFGTAIFGVGGRSERYPFSSSFDGGGHTIRNLVIRAKYRGDRSTNMVGLFGYIEQGSIVTNLRIEAADVRAVDNTAAILAGENTGRVMDCQVSGRVFNPIGETVAAETGGLVGLNTGDIVNCRADTDAVSGSQRVGGLVGVNAPEGRIAGSEATCQQVYAYRSGGGLVGMNFGYIVGSFARGGIVTTDSSSNHGGLVGANSGTILNCYAGANVAAGLRSAQLGGLVGNNWGTILNCYANGSISTKDGCIVIGGLIGWNGDIPVGSSGRIANSYAVEKIALGTNNKYIGGLTGRDTGGEVTMSFWDTEVSGISVSPTGKGLTTAQMQEAGTYVEAGWDFVDERTNGIADPWRMPEGGGYPVLTLGLEGDNARRLTGEGTIATPYQIATPDDLGILWRHDPSACYQLAADLDLAGIRWLGAPIATFSGIFDGGGFLISHLALRESRTAGLFGSLGTGALVIDLGVADANIAGGDDAQNLGILAGDSHFHSSVDGCYTAGWVTAGRRSQGLGGLIGWNDGFVTDCYAKVDLSCDEKSGRVGGLAGYSKGVIQRSYTAGTVTANDPNATCGGLLGTTDTPIVKTMLAACYFLAPSDGGGPDNGFAVPLTDAQLKQPGSFLYWDFKNTWTICAGVDYPRLRWEKIDCNQP